MAGLENENINPQGTVRFFDIPPNFSRHVVLLRGAESTDGIREGESRSRTPFGGKHGTTEATAEENRAPASFAFA